LPHRLLQVAMQWPVRRSQGCEVARVLKHFDTGRKTEFPLIRILINRWPSAFSPFSIFSFPFPSPPC